MGTTILGIPWIVVALAALALALLFAFVGPSGDVHTLRGIVVRFGHSACWLLLAAAALAMAQVTPLPLQWARPLATCGGLAYLAFLAATFLPS